MNRAQNTKPYISIWAHSGVNELTLNQVLYGIEEEGVPVKLTRKEEMNPLVLAHEAAGESTLHIGLGISLNWAVISTEALAEDSPYTVYKFGLTPECDRTIGSNTARLVKRMPLQPIEGK